MFFGNLPFDTQSCSYMLGMWSQTAAEVELRWLAGEDALYNWQAVGTAVWEVTDMRQEDQYLSFSSGSFTCKCTHRPPP